MTSTPAHGGWQSWLVPLQQLELSFHLAKTKYFKVWFDLQGAGCRLVSTCFGDTVNVSGCVCDVDRRYRALHFLLQSCQLQMENMSNCHPRVSSSISIWPEVIKKKGTFCWEAIMISAQLRRPNNISDLIEASDLLCSYEVYLLTSLSLVILIIQSVK